jgi:hypothetical protein
MFIVLSQDGGYNYVTGEFYLTAALHVLLSQYQCHRKYMSDSVWTELILHWKLDLPGNIDLLLLPWVYLIDGKWQELRRE